VEDAGRLRVLHEERVRAGQAFTLSYVHSSERVPVRGTFRVEADGSLTVTETRFAGFGPGLPALGSGDRWRMEDGMIVALTNARLPELRLRVTPIARYRLLTPSGRELDLAAAFGTGAVTIGISKIGFPPGSEPRSRSRLPGQANTG
jgi:hypothetical protein